MDVHLRELRYFLAVAAEGSVTRAAQTLLVSQPALSKQIRALERQLRVTLFERLPREVRLTVAGEELLPHARRLLSAWEEAQQALARRADCTVTIGMHTSPGRGLLPEVRARMLAACPDITLEMRQMPWADPTAGLADGAVDVAFAWEPGLPSPPYRRLTIARERRLVALPRSHRLAGRRSVRLAELLDEPFLALPESAGPLRDHFLALPERGGRPVTIAAIINDTEATYEAVASGVGICLLAAGNAPILARGEVVMPEVSDLPPAELVLAWHERRVSPLTEAIARACAEVVAESGGTDRLS
jgi:DNA-binding transcriptional LysR family regulator